MLNPYRMHYHEYDKEDHALAERFAQDLQQELDIILKEVIFFGSASRKKHVHTQLYERDIDVLIIIDDLRKVLSREVVEAYRVITEQTARKISTRLHINTLKLSAFWEYLANGDPISINILRDGMPLLNSGFVKPLQALLDKGQIRPSQENVWAYYLRAPQTLEGAKWHVLQGTIDCYWAVLDATHAALLQLGYAPNAPDETAKLLEDLLIKQYGFPKQYKKLFHALQSTQDRIMTRDRKQVSGLQYDRFAQAAKEYVQFVQQWIAHQKS